MPDCPVCHGAGEVTSSTTPHLDPRDPFHETRTDPCGCRPCPYSGESCRSDVCASGCMFTIAPVDPPDEPPDPMFDIAILAAKGAEEEARDTWGDRVVDAAIGRVLREDGWQ